MKQSKQQNFRLDLRTYLIIGIALLAITLISTCLSFYYGSIRDLVFENYAKNGEIATKLAADRINGDDVLRFLEQGYIDEAFLKENDEYLRYLKREFNGKYFYLFVPRENYLIYVYSAVNDGDDIYSKVKIGSTEAYYDKAQIFKVIQTGSVQRALNFTQADEYGYLASVYAPIKDSDGNVKAIFAIDYSMDNLMDEIYEDITIAAVCIIMIIIFFVGLFFFFQNRRLIQPLQQIMNSVKNSVVKCSADEFEEKFRFEPVEIRVNNEIRDLAEAYNDMAESIKTYITRLKEVTADKQAIETELEVAKNIQEMLLPHIFPPYTKDDHFSIYATIEAAKSVGGDYYDFYMIDADHVCVTIADVSGKGVPAALFMVIAKTIMKNQAMATGRPEFILEGTNNQLNEDNDEGMFVTAFVGILELSTGRFTYSNAGHNPPIIMKKTGEIEFLPVDRNIVLAIMGDMEFTAQETTLNQGDVLFLYTDGVTEAMDIQQNQFTEKKLIECLSGCQITSSLPDILQAVRQSLMEHVGEAEQSDDITMLAVRMD